MAGSTTAVSPGDVCRVEPAVLDSARRHGVADEDVLRALRDTLASCPSQGDWGLMASAATKEVVGTKVKGSR